MKSSMTAVKRNLHGKRVSRTVEGLLTTSDLDTMRTNILNSMARENIPASALVETDNKFELLNSTQFWMKPKLKKNAQGTIEFKSADYAFTDDEPHPIHGQQPSYGSLKGLVPLEDNMGFQMVFKGSGGLIAGTITYRLQAD